MILMCEIYKDTVTTLKSGGKYFKRNKTLLSVPRNGIDHLELVYFILSHFSL